MSPVSFRRKKQPNDEAASVILEGVTRHGELPDRITVDEILAALHERGFAFLMLIFVLPNCVPVPIPPGMSSLFSIPIIFLSIQMLFGKEQPWLPSWVKNKSIKRSTLALMVEKIVPKMRKLEKVMRPRLYRGDPKKTERVFGFISLIFGISIAVPMIMTNFLPGVGILLMSIGLLSRDGLISLIGSIIGFIGCAITIAVIWIGKEAVMALLNLNTLPM